MIDKINEFTNNYDSTLDYIPFISTIHNVIKIFKKTSEISETPIESRYQYRLKKNGYSRFFLLIIPVFGNLVVLIKDNIDRNKLLNKLRADGNELEHVSKFEQTKEVCLEAVAETPNAILFVNSDFDGTGDSEDYDLKDYKEVALCALSRDGLALKHIPRVHRTLELCQTAVANNGLALEFVPEGYRTPELCQTAVANNGLALEFVPEGYRTEKLCKTAAANNEAARQFFPQEAFARDFSELNL